jgi:Histidine kinase-, DNA gyrase B-, and HSP90-like ATPase
MSPNNEGNFAVRVDFERILETIAARIYDNQYAFLRENVQNAIDAIRMQAGRDKAPTDDPSYRIDILVADNECKIVDNGIGMTRDELINNFWTMGASGKNTPEARAAGCIGTFGIGGFANFGVCDTLEVTSRSATCSTAHRTLLSRAAFGNERFALPTVEYTPTAALSSHGTAVRGVAKQNFDVPGLMNYVRQFVRHVKEAIYYNGAKISQETFDSSSSQRRPLTPNPVTHNGLTFQLYADTEGTISVELIKLDHSGQESECRGHIRLVHGSVDAYKRGFRLCSTSVPSRIGVAGWIDCDQLRPTAGRDTLDSPSISLLTSIFQGVEHAASSYILGDETLLAAHIRLIPDFVRQGYIERLGLLRVELIGGQSMSLAEIRRAANDGQKVFYTSSGQTTAATEVLGARGHIIVRLSGNSQRRPSEAQYLSSFCQAKELDGLLDCLETYAELDTFERSVLSELDFSIRKLFAPPKFQLVAGRLTVDAPIYWTGRMDRDAVIVYVDTRHAEFQKLKPLGYSTFFWSMIETFCREYLSDTLKRQSVKFFGSGAIDLDAFSKANSELWELVLGDIEVSTIAQPASATRGGGRTEVVGRNDIANVVISSEGGVTADPTPSGKKAAKILNIVDETGNTGLAGYYLRIPESATAAFGDIIRAFPSFAVVWFANRVTWQGSDMTSTAFLFDVTLDRFLTAKGSTDPSHGSMDLNLLHVRTYEGQIYFLIPPILRDRIVPQSAEDLVKIKIQHELIDLRRPRAWTSKAGSLASED